MARPFVKNDPRTNRKGRPPRAETARKIFRELGDEVTEYKGVKMPKYKAVMLSIIEGAIGGDPQDKRLYMEYLYGKPKQTVEAKVSVSELTDDDLFERLAGHYEAMKIEREGKVQYDN